MVDLYHRGFDHWADGKKRTHNGFMEMFDFAVASPDVGTAGMILWVSASCYRRLFAAAPVVLL